MRESIKWSFVFIGMHLLFQILVAGSALWALAFVGKNWIFWGTSFIFFVFYFFLQNLLFCFFAQYIVYKTDRSLLVRIILLALAYVFFIWWLTRASLLIFGSWEGIPFFHPLIFFLNSLCVRSIVFYLGEWWGLFFLVLFFLVLWFFGCARRWLSVGGFLFLFCMTIVRETGSVLPDWMGRVVLVSVPFSHSISPGEHIQLFCSALAEAVRLHPTGEYFFFPESAYPFPFDSGAGLGEAMLGFTGGRTIAFGAYRKEGAGLFNTFFAIRDGVLLFYRDKVHGMPCVERLPVFFQGTVLERGLVSVCPDGFFMQSDEMPDTYSLGGNASVVPLICSEFFWGIQTVSIDGPAILLVVVNDAWFFGTLLPWLMWRMAWFKSLLLHRPIVYVGYVYHGVFDADGRWSDL